MELGIALEHIYSEASQASLKTDSDSEALAEIYLWDKYIVPLKSTGTRLTHYFLSLIPYFRQ